MSSTSHLSLEAIITMPEEDVRLHAQRIVAEGRAIEVLASMHTFNHQVCYKKMRIVALELFEALVKTYIETQDAKLAAFFKTLKWRNVHLQNHVYQECAERVRGIDALMTSALIFSITPQDASSIVQRNHMAERKALIFRTYAQNELAALQIRYTQICTVLQDVGLQHGNGIFRIVSDYEDEHISRMLAYAIHAKYKIYRNVYPHLYNLTLSCFVRFYITNDPHRDLYRGIELAVRIVDPVMRESVLVEVLRAMPSCNAERKALITHYVAAIKTVSKNHADSCVVEGEQYLSTLKLFKEIEHILENAALTI